MSESNIKHFKSYSANANWNINNFQEINSKYEKNFENNFWIIRKALPTKEFFNQGKRCPGTVDYQRNKQTV